MLSVRRAWRLGVRTLTALSKQEYDRIQNKQRNLPNQLARARHRVRQLESECIRYGMKELLADPDHASKAFDRELRQARAFNTEPKV